MDWSLILFGFKFKLLIVPREAETEKRKLSLSTWQYQKWKQLLKLPATCRVGFRAKGCAVGDGLGNTSRCHCSIPANTKQDVLINCNTWLQLSLPWLTTKQENAVSFSSPATSQQFYLPAYYRPKPKGAEHLQLLLEKRDILHLRGKKVGFYLFYFFLLKRRQSGGW